MKYLYVLFSIVFLLTSCNKDSVLINKKIEISPPQEIDGALIQGTIKTITGEKLEGVSIEIYQRDKKIGRVYSDNEGKYSTRDVGIRLDMPVTLKYNKNDYEKKYRRFDFEQNSIQNSNLIMGIESDSSGVNSDDFELINPSDTNLVKLFGYAKLADGTPVSGVRCKMVWKYYISTSHNLWIKEYIIDYTDEDGYFEILVPKRKDIYIKAIKNRYPEQKFSFCQVYFSDMNPTGELSDWHYMNLGVFTKDSNIDLKDDNVFEVLRTNITGKALRCDGTPVVNGTFRTTILLDKVFPFYSDYIKDYPFGSNGEFSIDIETCPYTGSNNFKYFVRTFIEDTVINFSGEKYVELADDTDIGQVDLCFDDNDYPDDFEVTIESVTRNYPKGGDVGRSGIDKLMTWFDYYEGDYSESIYLATDVLKIGEVPILDFRMRKGRKDGNIISIYETTFDAKPEDVTMTITKIEGHYVYGSIVGEVDTPRGRKPVSCTFKIYNK